jgi:transposase
MIIIGVDFHPEFQQIASVDTDTGEFQEKRLTHREEAEKIYRALACAGQKVRVGMEASGHARWFERLVAELQIELWIGDAAEIRTKRVRKQKTDRQDAQLNPEFAAGRSFPADLGAELGEPGSAATAVAPAPHGAGPHTHHEPVASGGPERRPAL